MRTAHARDVQWWHPSGHRGAGIAFKRLLSGTDGAPDDFELSLVRFPETYRTPRHRHNYDQIRVGLSGALNYLPGRDIGPGAVGYFPEGVPYGPQVVGGDPLAMAVQLGGAGGDGFFGYESLARGYRELAERGEFRDGVWRGPDPLAGGRVVNKDGYEAVWEHLAGRPIHYAEPAYAEPVVARLAGFRRDPVDGQPGVSAATLGVFTAGRTALTAVAVAAGATLTTTPAPAGQLVFVLDGAVDAGTAPLERHDAAHLEPGESAELKATEDADLLVIDLPRVATAPTPTAHVRGEERR
jgi:hypothetical protein